MIKIYLTLLLSLIYSAEAFSQTDEVGDKTFEMDVLQGQYGDILRSSISDIRDAGIPVYMGSDTVNSTKIYDSIPFSTYLLKYDTLKDFEIKYSIVDANSLEITPNRIKFFCKNHMVIDSSKVIFSITISDLRKAKKNQLCKKIFLDFFYAVYFKELAFSHFSVIDYKNFDDTERLIEAAAFKFIQAVNNKKVWVDVGLSARKTNAIPADSIYCKEYARLTYAYKIIEKKDSEFSFVIDKIGFTFFRKHVRRSGLEIPSIQYYTTPKDLKKILGEDFAYFILKGISQSFYNAISIY